MSVTHGLTQELEGNLFLSTMLDINTAEFCAEHGSGAGMIQLGTMLVAPEIEAYDPYRQRWPKAFLPSSEQAMCDFLANELTILRSRLGDVVVCLSIAGFESEDVVRAGRAFRDAGGQLLELNAHGRVEPWASQGYVGGMSLPQYRARLVAWTEALQEVGVPLLVKFNTHFEVDFAQACRDLAHIDLFGLHFNVRKDKAKRPDLDFVTAIRSSVKGMLLCSGYAWSVNDVSDLFAAGADSVGVAQPVLKDPGFLDRLARQVAAQSALKP